jgi:hypothetical protein
MLLLQGSILDYQLKMTDRKLDHLVYKIKSIAVYFVVLATFGLAIVIDY